MSAKERVKVGIIGSQFEADIHAESFRILPDEAEVVAVASPTAGNAERFGRKHGIPRVFTDYRQMLAERDIEMVTIAAPNALHAQMTVDAANAGKHVVCEKPLCMTLEEADLMIETCRRQGVLLFYAEELYFTPKYVKAKQMADEGAFGKVYLVKQTEKHFGPHAPWFWDAEVSGGGVFMDMGCHGIAFCWWFLGRPGIKDVFCHMGTYVHGDKTRGEDDCVCIIEFDNGSRGIIEDSWARRGGMDDRIEVYGEGGADLRRFAQGQCPGHLQRKRLRVRRRKGPHDQRLELAGFRRTLELRLSPGDASFRPLRARQGAAAGHGRGRAPGAGSAVRRLPVRRPGGASPLAFPAQGRPAPD